MDFEAQLAKFNYISGFGLMDFEAQLAVVTTVFTTACTIGPNPGRPPFQGNTLGGLDYTEREETLGRMRKHASSTASCAPAEMRQATHQGKKK